MRRAPRERGEGDSASRRAKKHNRFRFSFFFRAADASFPRRLEPKLPATDETIRTWFASVAGAGMTRCRGRTRLLHSLEVVVVHEEAFRGLDRQVVRIDRVHLRHHREERHAWRAP